jgi:hypothetical protein
MKLSDLARIFEEGGRSAVDDAMFMNDPQRGRRLKSISVLNARLSPDGKYALLFTNAGYDQCDFVMLDLTTLALSKVAAPESVDLRPLATDLKMSSPLEFGYDWFEGNRLLLNGPNPLYRIAW